MIVSQRKMDEFDAFKIYIAMKSHFQGEYDYVKYKGKQKVSNDAFQRRDDKKTFEELSRRFNKKELEEFLLAAFLDVTSGGSLALARNEFMWSGKLLDDETFDTHKEWKKRIQSLSYIFENDVKELLTKAVDLDLNFAKIFKSVHGEYPLIMKMESRGEISLETLIVFDKMFGFVDKVNINETTYWPLYKFKCQKYSAFLDINIDYYKDILKKIMVDDFNEEYGHLLQR